MSYAMSYSPCACRGHTRCSDEIRDAHNFQAHSYLAHTDRNASGSLVSSADAQSIRNILLIWQRDANRALWVFQPFRLCNIIMFDTHISCCHNRAHGADACIIKIL